MAFDFSSLLRTLTGVEPAGNPADLSVQNAQARLRRMGSALTPLAPALVPPPLQGPLGAAKAIAGTMEFLGRPQDPSVSIAAQDAREQARVRAGGGSGASAFAGGAASATTAPPTVEQVLNQQRSTDETVLNKLLSTNAMVGAGGYGGAGSAGSANERLRNIAANPEALRTLNEVQQLDRTGIQASVGANGQLSFTSAPVANRRQYETSSGELTTDYSKSAQYAQGVELANRERAQLAGIEQQRNIENLASGVWQKKTAAGQRTAAQLAAAQLGLVGEEAKTAASSLVASRKAGIDEQKLVLDAIKTQAEVGKLGAEGGLSNVRLDQVLRFIAGGGSPEDAAALTSGRPPARNRFAAIPSLTGDKITFADLNRPQAVTVTPDVQSTIHRDATGLYRMVDGKKVYLTPEEQRQITRPK